VVLVFWILVTIPVDFLRSYGISAYGGGNVLELAGMVTIYD
jgi:hypothetical protein